MPDGPLNGARVVELAGIGPTPFGGMLLADLGADVVRVDRTGEASQPLGRVRGRPTDVLGRGRRSIAVDLKHPDGTGVALRLIEAADVLLEGFRPGVSERLGVGPAECLARNPRLVYGRMTGWGQTGPWARRPGHDLGYAALAGGVHAIGPPEAPPPVPLNYLADFGGGGMLLAFGVVAALWERERSGRGQVIDAAMVDGVASLTALFHGLAAGGLWSGRRQDNLLDGAAPFYRTYETADGGFLAVAALEPPFYARLLTDVGLDPADWPQHDRTRWPALGAALAERFASRPRDEWLAVLHQDACAAPVLAFSEAPEHPHLAARGTFAVLAGVCQPAPAPRFSRTPGALGRPPAAPGAHTDEILAELGVPPDDVRRLREDGAVA